MGILHTYIYYNQPYYVPWCVYCSPSVTILNTHWRVTRTSYGARALSNWDVASALLSYAFLFPNPCEKNLLVLNFRWITERAFRQVYIGTYSTDNLSTLYQNIISNKTRYSDKKIRSFLLTNTGCLLLCPLNSAKSLEIKGHLHRCTGKLILFMLVHGKIQDQDLWSTSQINLWITLHINS